MFSLSPLSTAHPLSFQHQSVRTSSACYRTFILAMDRSLGFGSTPSDRWRPSGLGFLRLPYSVKLATECKSLTHYTKVRSHPYGSDLLYACGFRIYFTPPGVFFRLSSRYLFTIGRLRVFSLGGWSPYSDRDFSCPALLVVQLSTTIFSYIRGYHHHGRTFQTVLLSPLCYHIQALPISLATTLGNLGWCLFLSYWRCFSSPVRPLQPMYSVMQIPLRSGFPHSDICGSKLICQLPQLFRRLSRPFIACNRQGIHHMLLVIWPYNFDTWLVRIE